jgi:hypothetical protein
MGKKLFAAKFRLKKDVSGKDKQLRVDCQAYRLVFRKDGIQQVLNSARPVLNYNPNKMTHSCHEKSFAMIELTSGVHRFAAGACTDVAMDSYPSRRMTKRKRITHGLKLQIRHSYARRLQMKRA